MFVETWPHQLHPVVDGEVDTSATVEVFQLRPNLVDDLQVWSGGQIVFVNGGSAVLLPGKTGLTTRLVGLGDFAVLDSDGRYRAEPADGFWQRYGPPAEPPDGELDA